VDANEKRKENPMQRLALLLAILSLLFQCGGDQSARRQSFNPEYMDVSVRPGDDFYQYANGNWLANNPIPSDYSSWGSFNILYEQNLQNLKTIMENAARQTNLKEGSSEQKMGDFFASGMDTVKINTSGLEPLRTELDLVRQCHTPKDIQQAIIHLHNREIFPVFIIFNEQDPKNSVMVSAWLYQGGLGLPDRDYYVQNDVRSRQVRQEYSRHVRNILALGGVANPEKAAQSVMQLETRLASASMTKVEERDPVATCNRMDVAGLGKIAPAIDWLAYFKGIGLTGSDTFNVAQPRFFSAVSRLLNDVSIADWQSYLTWHLLHSTAPYLDTSFVNENFAFYGKYLSGVKEVAPRWKRVLTTTSNNLGEIVGQVYVKRYFPPVAKKRALELVGHLKVAMRDRIEKLDWMSAETKQKALEKLEKFGVKIGYPDKWIDYSALTITRDSYVGNVLNARLFDFGRSMAKVGKPIDRSEWFIPPQTVNAFYNPPTNEIVFPAAILQPPFFNYKADDAVNYGGIGMVIGHEMTHGFDDSGRQYDKDGNLQNWWTTADETNFKARTEVLVKQFNSFVTVDTFHVNGRLTLGENISDLGGLALAYDALQSALGGKTTKLIDGFSPAQRFFLANAQVWKENTTPDYLKLLVKTDPHSPAKFRIIGPFRNIDSFYATFDVQPGDKMYLAPEARARIW